MSQEQNAYVVIDDEPGDITQPVSVHRTLDGAIAFARAHAERCRYNALLEGDTYEFSLGKYEDEDCFVEWVFVQGFILQE